MPYRVIFAENSIEVAFDTPDEGRPVFEAVLPFLPFPCSAPSSAKEESASDVQSQSPRAMRSAKRGDQVAAWLPVLRSIRDVDEGMTGNEICHRTGVAAPPGLGRSLSPVKTALEQQGVPDWDNVVNKARVGDTIRWVRGSLIGEAIAALEAYQVGRKYIPRDLPSPENASATADHDAPGAVGSNLL